MDELTQVSDIGIDVVEGNGFHAHRDLLLGETVGHEDEALLMIAMH